MRSPGEGGLVEVHLGSVGHVAGVTRVKHTTKLKVDQRARVWAVLAVPGFFRARFEEKSAHERQARARSPSAQRRPLVQANMLSVAQLTESPWGRIIGLSLGINFDHRCFLHIQTGYPPQLATI
jgi:hypothetical protein